MQLVTTQHLFFCFPIKMCTFPLFCCFFFFCLTSRPSHSLPSLSARPPTGPSADSAARPHSVGSGQAPRGMKSSSQIELKAWEMRKGPQYVGAQKPVSSNRSCCENYKRAAARRDVVGGADGYGLVLEVYSLCFPASVVCLYFPPAQLDVAIDGADEVDADLTLIKGGGWVEF